MAQITLNSAGVASNGTLKLQSNGTTDAVTIDTAQNMGLGVTPSAWGSPFKAFQFGANGGSLNYRTDSNQAVELALNWFYDGTNSKYINSNWATRYRQFSGAHEWYTAASGTAGNTITFTQAMTLDASGRLGIGSTSPSAKLTLKNPSSSGEQIIANIESASSSSVVGRLTYDQTNDIMRLVNMSSYSGAGLRFGVNGLDQVNIDLSGNLLVGTTTSTGVGFTFLPQATVVQNNNAGSSGFVFQSYRRSGVEIGYIDQNGTTAVRYSTTSDYRLKENVLPMTGALAKVAQLKPCTYKWKSDGSNGEGFIAHELAEVCPQAVTRSKDAVDADGNPVYQGIDTSFLVATLTAAIQELKAEFDAYKASHP